MIDSFAQKLLQEHALIGRVIAQATTIERILDAYVADFYTRCHDGDYQSSYLAFMYDVMNDRGVSLDTKITILFKVFKRIGNNEGNPSRSLFDKWLKIRNIVAHGTYIPDKGILYGGDFFDVIEVADKHAKLQQEITLQLEKFAELRGPYFNQLPIKNEGDV